MDETRDFEPLVIEHIKDIFGPSCEYFPKRKLKTLADNRSIPDGFIVDFENKKWYVVELKLLCDDAVNRISGQIVNYKNAIENPTALRGIYKAIKSIRDADFLDDLINETRPQLVVIINNIDGGLGAKFREQVRGVDKDVKVVVFKTFARIDQNEKFVNPNEIHCHVFKPLYNRTPQPPLMKPPLSGDEDKKLHRTPRGLVTPQKEYRMHIIGALREMGGKGKTKDVLRIVEKRMRGILKKIDYDKLPSGMDTRWSNAAMWERQEMVDEGLLKPSRESGRGIWEITEKGKRYYEEHKKL
ncbi:MAG: winged helix-turn-helix domain-containing protein [Candidatus Altiarchaeota archaeon]